MTTRTSAYSKAIRMLTVANMYPSAKDPVYGTFVRNFVEEIDRLNTGGTNDLVVIKGRRFNALSKLAAYISFYSRLTFRLLFGKYDLIYIHTITFPIPPVRIIGLFRKLPLVFNVHGDDVLPSGKLKKLLKRISIPEVRKAKMVVSPSDYFKGVLLDEIPGLDPAKIFVSPSGGIDAKFFRDQSSIAASDHQIPLIGYVSRIDNGKGWDTFLKALSELKSKGLKIKAVIAGRGAQTPMMLQMISDLQLTDCVDYLGPVAQEELPKLYASFDIFIFPSIRLNESLGLVGLEAMAAGIPVIASNMAGPAGYVRHNVNGYLFQPGNHTELAKAISLFLNATPEVQKAMRTAAAETAKKYDSKKVVEEMYDKLLSIT